MNTPPAMDCDTDAARLIELANGLWTTQALYAAAELGLADALACAGSMSAADLACQTSCDPGAVQRLLHGLAALGVCQLQDADRYALTALGAPLAAAHPRSLQPWVLMAGRRQWATWAGFTESVRTGQCQRSHDDDANRFERLQRDPAEARDLHRAMQALTQQVAEAVALRVAPLAHAGARVVDVGGGSGQLLCAVLQSAPAAHGTVLDRAHAAAAARSHIADSSLLDRASFVPGDFFEAVPAADLVLLKSVLHDWDDARCEQLLGRVAAALQPGGAVAVIERLLPEQCLPTAAHRHTCRSDLNMLVATGGRERSLDEFERLLSQAGMRVDEVLPAALDFCIILARAAR